MKKKMFLYTLLTIGLMSCNLNSKLSGNKEEQKNNNDIKEALNGVQENAINNLYGNKKEKKDFIKNSEKLKDKDLDVTTLPLEPVVAPSVESAVSLETSNNKVSIPTISIKHNQKRDKKEDLSPSTKEEKKADKAIKDIENLIRDSGFPELIENVCSLKHEYTLIKSDFYDVITKIQNKKISLMKNSHNNRNKIRELVQLQNNLKIGEELDKIMGCIDTAEQEIRSAAFFFDEAKESLKEGIIKRLEKSKNRAASQLSKKALNRAEDALRCLETYSSKKGEAIGRRSFIKEVVEQAKNALSKS
ncbi:P12 family lipoprotein [Borreliella burgdorferi]|uniref:P12 family lipoprotein n=1 Tax=Borreliella burgdorferi TaxID=139 RepID=UPI001E5CCD3D|nr:P12 family lipoprotein [Borreliella burgdorferi]MCD2393516.1 P12 family lipoprotein [Borreliella burgdorferi]